MTTQQIQIDGSASNTIRHDHGVTEILTSGTDLVRVFHAPHPEAGRDRYLSLIRHDELDFRPLDLADKGDRFVSRHGHLVISVDRANGLAHIEDRDGRVRFAERGVSFAMFGGSPAARLDFASPDGEHLFGGGQFQHHCANLRNCYLDMRHYNTGIPIPYFVSSTGYGLLWDGLSRLELNPDLERIEMQRFSARLEQWAFFRPTSRGRHVFILKLHPDSGARPRLLADGKAVIDIAEENIGDFVMGAIDLEADAEVDLVVEGRIEAAYVRRPEQAHTTGILGHHQDWIDYALVLPQNGPRALDEIARGYRRLAGRASLPPRYALGFWQCCNTYPDQNALLEALRGYRRRGIPLDVIVQDFHYWLDGEWGSCSFDPDRFPEPAGMCDEVHRQNARLMISCWPAMTEECDCHRQFKENGWLLPKQKHQLQPYDPFNPEAREAYSRLLRERLDTVGVDLYWLDGTEPGFHYDLSREQTVAGPGASVVNVFCREHARGVYENWRKTKPDRRVCTLTRSAYPGQQSFGSLTWSGDVGSNWKVLRQQVTASLHAAVGIPYWHTDIGGHYGTRRHDPDFRDLLVRWFQVAAYWPIMRNHRWGPTEIWRFGEATEPLLRHAIKERYRLLDYWYTQAALCHFEHAQLLSPPAFRFPEDPAAYAIDDQFMAGDSLMACPVTEPGATERTVYLPEHPGGWYERHTHRQYDGGKTHTVPAPLDRMPVFVPAGTILPLSPPRQWSGENTSAPLELRVYPGADGTNRVYFDAGEGYGFERGESAWLTLTWNDAEAKLTIDHHGKMPPAGPGFEGLKITLIQDGRPVIQHELPNRDWIQKQTTLTML